MEKLSKSLFKNHFKSFFEFLKIYQTPKKAFLNIMKCFCSILKSLSNERVYQEHSYQNRFPSHQFFPHQIHDNSNKGQIPRKYEHNYFF